MRRTAALATVALITAGCGSNAPSETSANTARDEGMKFAACMRDNGVSGARWE